MTTKDKLTAVIFSIATLAVATICWKGSVVYVKHHPQPKYERKLPTITPLQQTIELPPTPEAAKIEPPKAVLPVIAETKYKSEETAKPLAKTLDQPEKQATPEPPPKAEGKVAVTTKPKVKNAISAKRSTLPAGDSRTGESLPAFSIVNIDLDLIKKLVVRKEACIILKESGEDGRLAIITRVTTNPEAVLVPEDLKLLDIFCLGRQLPLEDTEGWRGMVEFFPDPWSAEVLLVFSKTLDSQIAQEQRQLASNGITGEVTIGRLVLRGSRHVFIHEPTAASD